jgi:hypothetical protein
LAEYQELRRAAKATQLFLDLPKRSFSRNEPRIGSVSHFPWPDSEKVLIRVSKIFWAIFLSFSVFTSIFGYPLELRFVSQRR